MSTVTHDEAQAALWHGHNARISDYITQQRTREQADKAEIERLNELLQKANIERLQTALNTEGAKG